MKKIFILTIVWLCFATQINAQCCSAGNPSNQNVAFGISKNSIDIFSSILHSYSDTYYEDSKPTDWTYLKNMQFNFGKIGFSYGLSDKVKLSSEIGYFIDKSLKYDFIDSERKAKGLGDALIGIQYHLYTNKQQMIDVFPEFKISLPVGAFDQRDGNIILPIDIQPSSGSYKLIPSLLLIKNFYNSKYMLSAFVSCEYSEKIQTERTNYKYGNLYIANFEISRQSIKNINTALALKIRHRDKAINKNEIMNYTGGTYINIQPSLSVGLKNNYALNTFVSIPLYKSVNGIQLTNKYAVGIGIKKRFTLKSVKPQIDPKIL